PLGGVLTALARAGPAPDHAPREARSERQPLVRRSPAPGVDLVDWLEWHCTCGGGCAEFAAAAGRGLPIGPPDDVFEREADSIVDRVLAGVDPGPASALPGPAVQRACACGGSHVEEAGGEECAECRAERLQRKPAGLAPAVAPSSVSAVVGSPGRGLDVPVRSSMEAAFGRDFGDVRVHTDGQAARSAADVGALAYTVGRHVVFAENQFRPLSQAGRRLIAHELAHVVQARAPPALARTPVVRRACGGALPTPTPGACDPVNDGVFVGGKFIKMVSGCA